MSLSSPPHYLIASLGSIGKRHYRNLRALRPQAVITVLRRPESEPVTTLGEEIAEVYSIEAALALKPDAAILAGPAPTHVALAQRFAENGIPVFVEKPLSHNLVGLTALSRTANENGLAVMVAYNLRYNKALVAVREQLLRGTIGNVLAVRAEVGQYLPDWRPDSNYRDGVSANKALGGGPLLELSHEIDFLYWIFGMPKRVSGVGGRFSDLDIDVEDCIELCFEYDSPRRIISLHLDFLQRPAARLCKFIGSIGTLTWDALEDTFVVETVEPTLDRKVMRVPTDDRNQMYIDELSEFLAAVESRGDVSIPLSQGIDVMRIIDAAARSIASGRAEAPKAFEDFL